MIDVAPDVGLARPPSPRPSPPEGGEGVRVAPMTRIEDMSVRLGIRFHFLRKPL